GAHAGERGAPGEEADLVAVGGGVEIAPQDVDVHVAAALARGAIGGDHLLLAGEAVAEAPVEVGRVAPPPGPPEVDERAEDDPALAGARGGGGGRGGEAGPAPPGRGAGGDGPRRGPGRAPARRRTASPGRGAPPGVRRCWGGPRPRAPPAGARRRGRARRGRRRPPRAGGRAARARPTGSRWPRASLVVPSLPPGGATPVPRLRHRDPPPERP